MVGIGVATHQGTPTGAQLAILGWGSPSRNFFWDGKVWFPITRIRRMEGFCAYLTLQLNSTVKHIFQKYHNYTLHNFFKRNQTVTHVCTTNIIQNVFIHCAASVHLSALGSEEIEPGDGANVPSRNEAPISIFCIKWESIVFHEWMTSALCKQRQLHRLHNNYSKTMHGLTKLFD